MIDFFDFDGIIWVTADLHLGHEEVLGFTKRPWKNIDRHDNAVIKNAHRLVRPQDVYIIIGDLTLTGSSNANRIRRYISRLPGRKILVLGNHDHMKAKWYVKAGFELATTALVLPGGVLVVHDPQEAAEWPREKPVVCGHWHDTFMVVDNVVNAGIDVWGYDPIPLEKALSKCVRARGNAYKEMMLRHRHCDEKFS